MRKILSVILAFATAATLFGCGTAKSQSGSTTNDSKQSSGTANSTASATGASSTSDKKTIEFWMLPTIDEAKIQSLVDDFNKQSSTTHVDLKVLAWSDGREQIKQAVAAGSGPDVFYLSAGLDASLVDAKMLLPLDENGYSKDDMNKFSELINASTVDGHLYAAPMSYETYMMYYRTDILEEYGFKELPKSWEELKTMASKISKDSNGKVMGFQFKGTDDQLNAINYSWQTVLSENGGKLMDPDGKKSMESSDEGIKALEFMKSFYSEGISKFGTSANTAFREGVLASYCFTNGPLTTEKFISDEMLKGKWAIGPMFGDGGYIGGHAISASASTASPKNCVEFMKWFTSPANAPKWMTLRFEMPPYNLDKLSKTEADAINTVYDQNPEIWKTIKEATSKADVNMFSQSRYGYTARWDAQKRLIISALNGETPVKDALTQIDTEVNQSL